MITIKFIIDKQKSIALDNDILIGECEYIVNDNTWNIIHTTVNSNYQGQGIAKKLVLNVLEKVDVKSSLVMLGIGLTSIGIYLLDKNESKE